MSLPFCGRYVFFFSFRTDDDSSFMPCPPTLSVQTSPQISLYLETPNTRRVTPGPWRQPPSSVPTSLRFLMPLQSKGNLTANPPRDQAFLRVWKDQGFTYVIMYWSPCKTTTEQCFHSCFVQTQTNTRVYIFRLIRRKV